eukprot:sb/3464100/
MLAAERARSQRAEAETSEEADGRRKERSLQEDKVGDEIWLRLAVLSVASGGVTAKGRRKWLDHIRNASIVAESLADKSRFSRERESLEAQTREMKTKLRHEQYEREQEQTHHVAMLREIQQMLAAERARSQRAEAETSEEADGRRKERSLQEDKVKLLMEEKNYLTRELENCRNTPKNRIMELEQELEDLRSCKSELDQLRQEQTDTSHLNMRTSTEQHRIRDLENRVTELSELVSDYDRRQQRDQREIERLMSRVTVLESEEKRVLSSVVPTVNVNVNTVVNTAQQQPVTSPSPTYSPSPVIPATAGELRELASVEVARRKEELQIYKGETERLRSEKVRLHSNLVEISEQHKLALSELSLQHELQIREMEKGHSAHLADLQESSNKARSRAQELLTERECEIAELKGQLENRSNRRARDGRCRVVGAPIPRKLYIFVARFYLSHIRPSSSHRAEGPVRLREAAQVLTRFNSSLPLVYASLSLSSASQAMDFSAAA